MTIQIYLTYLLACIAITIIPGPTVTLIIANSLSHGTRAGLLNVAGTQLGLAMMLGVLLVGLSSIIATMGWWFDWVRIAGAVYLVWIGWKLLRSSGALGELDKTPKPRGGFFLQGFLVLLSNPKVLVFFGAFIPQFMDMEKPHLPQVALLGITFMVIAASTDAVYALLAGRARLFFSKQRTRLLSRISGGFMIGGGIWLALTRAK